MGDSSAGTSRPCRRPGPSSWRRTIEAWTAEGDRVVLASDQALRLAELLTEQKLPTAVTDRIAEAPRPGTRTLIGRSLNGGFAGGPDALMLVTDRELFGASASAGPRRSAEWCRATFWSG